MSFLNPLYLWALTGLSIPIAIHLLSRKEGKVIRMGSLRHLQETSTKQFRGIKLNEILLLILRCLLIILFCLLLSGLQWNSSGTRKWVLIEKGIETGKLSLDSLKSQNYELHWLAKDFPIMTQGDTSSFTSPIPYSDAIQQLNLKKISEVIIFATNNTSSFKGPRISLPSNVRWITVTSKGTDYVLQRVQLKSDSVFVRKGHSDYEQTYFTNETTGEKVITGKIEPLKEVTVLLVGDEKYQYDKKIITASLNAIDQSFPSHLILKEISDDNLPQADSTSWIVWLSDTELPGTAPNLIVLQPQLSNTLLIQNKRNQWIITKRLTVESALYENLTYALAEIILPDQKALQLIANTKDMRMIPDSIAWSDKEIATSTTSASIINTPANALLLALFFITLLTERIIAYRRNQ